MRLPPPLTHLECLNGIPSFEADENVTCECDCSAAFVDNDNLGSGTLFITTARVVWVSSVSTNASTSVNTSESRSFMIEYPKISLHAISRDVSVFPHPCIYCQIDAASSIETRFVPQDSQALDNLFSAMSECQSLHSDPEDQQCLGNGGLQGLAEISSLDGSSLLDENRFYFHESDAPVFGEKQADLLARLNSVLVVNPDVTNDTQGQFDDAEEGNT